MSPAHGWGSQPYSRSPDCQPVPGYHAASAHFSGSSPAPPVVPSSTQNLCPEESLQEEQDLPWVVQRLWTCVPTLATVLTQVVTRVVSPAHVDGVSCEWTKNVLGHPTMGGCMDRPHSCHLPVLGPVVAGGPRVGSRLPRCSWVMVGQRRGTACGLFHTPAWV